MSEGKVRVYEGEQIAIRYDVKRCIHAAECVTRLRSVFDNTRRPWIEPDNATAEDAAAAIRHCPTGALTYTRRDGGADESPDAAVTLHIRPDGPLHVRGAITLKTADGTVQMAATRLALCRCGVSKNKPFCDNSHLAIDFKAQDNLAANSAKSGAITSGSQQLTITAEAHGPLHIEGDFTIYSGDNTVQFTGSDAWLCRCGGSNNKPFCDSTHRKNNFQAP